MDLFRNMNKEEAEQYYDLVQNITALTNLMKLSPDIASNNELLDGMSLNNAVQKTIADSLAKKFNIAPNPKNMTDPVGGLETKLIDAIANGMNKTAKGVANTVQNTINWGKQVKQSWPETQKIFLEKLDNDLNIPRKINEVFTPPKIEIEMGKPTKSIDSKGNVTLYGQIEKNENSEPKSRYKGYTNPLTNDNRIFSREDIGSFTTKEYSATEPEIMAQWRKIGIPTNGDLELDSRTTGGTVFVQAYTRSDGTKVKAHYRAA